MRNFLLSGFHRLRAHPLALLALLLASRASFAQTTAYCNTGLGGFCGSSEISAFSITNTTLNATGLTCGAAGGQSYTSYPASGSNTATLSGGVPYTLTVTPGPSTSTTGSILSVWIDANHNFLFEASEWTQVATNAPVGTPTNVSIIVPSNAVQGQTGLRIRSRNTGNSNGATDACSNFGSGETKDFTVTIGAPAACPGVTGPGATNITATGATVNFTPATGVTSYTVTATPTSGTPITQTGTTSPITLTGLTASTLYTVSIVGNCGASGTSVAATFSFQSGCATPPYVVVNSTTPYMQDFETAWLSRCNTNDAPSANWLNTPATGNTSWRRDDDGASAAWVGPTSGAYTPPGSPLGGGTSLHSARFHSYNVSGRGVGTLDLYANLSSGTGTPTLIFDYLNTSGSDSVKVQFSTNGGSTFSTIASSGVGIAAAWTRRTVNLPSTGLTATCVVRLRAVGDFGITDIGVDNVQLAFVTCPAVTAPSISNVTATGATLSFTPSAGPTSYTITITPATGAPTTQTATTSPVALTGLTGSTSYTVSIVGNCGAGSTSLPTVVTFQTSCVAPPYVVVNSTTPYTQDFETVWLSRCNTRDAPSANWLNTPLTGNASWRRDDDGASAAWSGTFGGYTPAGSPLGGGTSLHSARFHSYDVLNRGVGTLDLYTNLSSGTGTPTLSFDYINTSGSDSVRVQLSTNGGSTFTNIAGSGVGIAATWTRRTVNLPTTGLTATTVVRLRAVGDFGVTDIGIDNVQLAFITCPAVTGLSITSTSATSVNLTFTPVAGAASYTLTLTPAGGGAPTTQTVTGSPIALTGLTPGATYTASLVSSCGSNGTSQPAVLTFAVPAGNDECAGAVNVPVQFGTVCVTQTSADNTTATTSTGPTPSCSTTLDRDIWFKVTVPASGVVTVKTVAPTGGSNITDTVISLYSGTCGSLTEIGCNDDTNGLYSQVALTGRTPGEVLYIRAWSYSATASGLIAVCVTTPSNCPAPLGPTVTNITNVSAQLNWVAPSNAPAGATYEIEYGLQGFTQGTGTSVTGLTGLTYQLTSLTPNSDYCFYLRLNCGATNGSSTYVGPICFSTPLTVPTNDDPCGAVTLGAATVNGSTSGATTSAQPGIPLPTCSSAQLPKDVWFAFTATTTSYRLTVTGTAAGLVRVLTSPSCSAGPFAQLPNGCFAGPGNNQNVGPVALSGLTVGTRYYVAVSGYGSADNPGSFTILGTVTATKAQADTDALLVYPNPSNTGQLTLRLSNVSKAGEATLLNALGQVVATKSLSATTEQTLNTRGLATGVYTLRVTVAGQVLTRKVVLE